MCFDALLRVIFSLAELIFLQRYKKILNFQFSILNFFVPLHDEKNFIQY